ncbi:hypothetical protein H2200_010189 [Cladophialophora chaetospira]|uniref:Uncharacterized protein n=1 Tax=Cladophialophora chaetospira TaxID=386627 RepID=A0AA38X2F5_9EURO|nr:hypothetical protein H2200_010189 [Cladophialophora chaetospira]
MPADYRSKKRGCLPALSTQVLPPGYQWQEDVLAQARDKADKLRTAAVDVKMPPVHFGRTLVFRMAKPSDWDTLHESAKWLKKREYLCDQYGYLCFTFLEDPEALRNELGRIIVAPKDYYTLFEVQNVANVETQYRASMLLLEQGLGMELRSFDELKNRLGMRWAEPITVSNKRPREEDILQTSKYGVNGGAVPNKKVKRVPIQEPTPGPEPVQVPKPNISAIASLSQPEKHQIYRSLFPAAWMESDAAKFPTRKPRVFRPFTTIRRTKFAKRLQVLQPSQQVQVTRYRLCRHYGQGKRYAVAAEVKHRENVVSRLDKIIQSCSSLAPDCNLETDKIVEILAHCLRCVGHQDLTSGEYVKATIALKWAFLYMAFLKTVVTSAKVNIGQYNWVTKWEGDMSAKIELFQYVQDRTWLRFCLHTARFEQVMMARSNDRNA